LGAIAAVLVLFAVVRPGVSTPPAEADITGSGGISAIPSAAPGIPGLINQQIPALIPASGPGNEAIITVFIDGFGPEGTLGSDGIHPPWLLNCKEDVSLLTATDRCRVTFEVQALDLATGDLVATGARFLANGGATLQCADDSPCDVDGLNNGVIAVKMRGGGKNEVLQVTATDETGDARNVQVITTQTMQVLPPVLEPSPLDIPALDDVALVSYSCVPTNNIGRSVFSGNVVDTLEDFWLSVYGPSIYMAVGGGNTGHVVIDPETQLPVLLDMTSDNPFFRCGGDTDSLVDDTIAFQTNMGILSVDSAQVIEAGPLVYPFIAGDCDEGDSITVADGGIFEGPALNDNQIKETCDLDAAPNGVVNYMIVRSADATGVATINGQQGANAASTLSAQLDFVGVVTLALDLSGIPNTVSVLAGGAAIPIEIVVLSTQAGTGPGPVAGLTVSCVTDPANAAFALLPQTDTTDASGVAAMGLIPTGIPGTKFTITCSIVGHPEVAPVSKEVTVVLPGQENLETVDLVQGCNPVSSTWPDGTTAAAAAEKVDPAEALNALWKFDPVSGSWQGFDPAAPAGVSNLASIDFLDVVFICVSDAATWSRVAIS